MKQKTIQSVHADESGGEKMSAYRYKQYGETVLLGRLKSDYPFNIDMRQKTIRRRRGLSWKKTIAICRGNRR
tara:strand:- start:296 stop:511 length:216 start_codon:yes stop_codon:yes gene_type:complete